MCREIAAFVSLSRCDSVTRSVHIVVQTRLAFNRRIAYDTVVMTHARLTLASLTLPGCTLGRRHYLYGGSVVGELSERSDFRRVHLGGDNPRRFRFATNNRTNNRHDQHSRSFSYAGRFVRQHTTVV